MKTKCSCGRMIADEQLNECDQCNCLLCDLCGLGHTCDMTTKGTEEKGAPRYYVCSDTIFQRLRKETQALFERYPEDDGVMVFNPDKRISIQAERIAQLEGRVEELQKELNE